MKKVMLAMIEKRIEEKYGVLAFKRDGKLDKETGLFNFRITTMPNNRVDCVIYNGFVSSTGSIVITYINGIYLGKDNFEII